MMGNGAAGNGALAPLITRYRPQDFAEIRGHAEAVSTLQRRVAQQGHPHAYLFSGNSGVGKTTLARIVGRTLNADVLEVDAASHNGVDAMRALVEAGYYIPPGAAARLVILDECHRLSRPAFDIILKLLEEPPAHLYLALCTTELYKIPETIRTRCYHVSLGQVGKEEITDLLVEVMAQEGWDNVDYDVFHMIVQECRGSPRLALSMLQGVYDATPEEARRIINITTGSDNPLIQVMQILLSGQGGWEAIQPMLEQISDDDFAETNIIQAGRYVIGAMVKEPSSGRAKRMWSILAALTYPAHGYDPKATFVGAVGRVLWSPE